MTAYADAALIRETDDLFLNPDGTDNTDDFPDLALTTVCDHWANPELDGMMAVAGITVPVTSPPQWLKCQAAKWTLAEILSGKLSGFTARNPERAKELKDEVRANMKALAARQIVITGLAPDDEAGPVVVDETPECLHYHSTFTGDETTWKFPTQHREASDGSEVCECDE